MSGGVWVFTVVFLFVCGSSKALPYPVGSVIMSRSFIRLLQRARSVTDAVNRIQRHCTIMLMLVRWKCARKKESERVLGEISWRIGSV